MVFTVFEWLYMIALVSARLLPCFIFLPFLNANVLPNSIRYPVAFIICFALFPISSITDHLAAFSWVYLLLLLKELTIGLFLACIFSMPFWTLYIMGNIIDQQRGATLSSSYDPLSGIDSSELASFFNLFAALIFLIQGGILYMLQVLQLSYQVIDPLSFQLPDLLPFLSLLGIIVSKGLILSAPVLASLFIVEISLGLLSRYCAQMNAFSLAIGVKSLVAFFILLIYFTIVAPTAVYDFSWGNAMAQVYFNNNGTVH